MEDKFLGVGWAWFQYSELYSIFSVLEGGVCEPPHLPEGQSLHL